MRVNSIYVKVVLVTSSFAIVACNNNSNQSSEENGLMQLANDTIEIAQSSNLIGKLKTEKVTLSPYGATIKTTGEITAIPTEYADSSTFARKSGEKPYSFGSRCKGRQSSL